MYIALLFVHISNKRQKRFIDVISRYFFIQSSFLILEKKFFFFLSMVMLNGICPNQTSTRTRNPLYRYRLHVSNNKYHSVNIFSFFLI
jgi:hypothetical protein